MVFGVYGMSSFVLKNQNTAGVELNLWSGGESERAHYRNGTATDSIAIENKKGSAEANPLNFLAPRPGLEPGTCGLTEIQARQKPCKINDVLPKNQFV